MKVKDLQKILSQLDQNYDIIVRNSEDIMDNDGYIERYYNDNILSTKDVYVTNLYGKDVVVIGE